MTFACRTPVSVAVLAVAATVASARPTTGPAPAPWTSPAVTPFVAVLDRDFDRFDADHDGTITAAEIDRAVADRTLTGDDAAAAAAMKMVTRGRAMRQLPPLTRAYFADYNAKARTVLSKLTPEAAPRAADGSIAPTTVTATTPATSPAVAARRLPHWDVDFKVARRALAADGTRPAWDPAAIAADLGHLHQSNTMGDCWLVASVGSLAVHRPDGLRQLVTVRPDGGCTVNLFGADPVELPPLTDAQRACGATSVGDGAWVAVLEQAIGRAKSVRHGGRADVDGNDEIVGGDSQEAIGFLTGHQVHRFTFARTVAARAEQRDKVLPAVRAALLANIAAHREVTAGIDPPRTKAEGLPTIPDGFGVHHVYAILAYDPKADLVEVWNPWGQTFHPKGPAGLANGYEADHGRLRLPLTDAYQFYTSFTFETDQPTTRPTRVSKAG